MEYSKNKMQELLQKHDFFLKKNFGQNFIIDQNTIQAIIKKSGIDQNTLVLEIGPGAGSLTYFLAQSAEHVLCYEIDTKLKPILEETLQEFSNVTIHYKDFLKANVKEELKKYPSSKCYVVANLPYYITTPIIMKLIEEELPIEKCVIMVQKEVGDRFQAKPNTKEYNSLSVYLNYYFEIKKILNIRKEVFLPKPKVDSIVLEMTRKKIPFSLKNESLFFDLVKRSFTQKRKTLRNNLNGYYDLEKIREVLKRDQLDLSVRAEQLSIEQFVELANALSD